MEKENERDIAILSIAIMIIGALFIGGYSILVGMLFYVYMTHKVF